MWCDDVDDPAAVESPEATLVTVKDGPTDGWREETISKAEERVLAEVTRAAEGEVIISPVMNPLVGGGAEVVKWRVDEEVEEEGGAAVALSCAHMP